MHVLGELLNDRMDGEKLFPEFSTTGVLKLLRSILEGLGVEKPGAYRTHDLRRGHALDLQLSGASLYDILKAGEWRSPAFLQYLDIEQLVCITLSQPMLVDVACLLFRKEMRWSKHIWMSSQKMASDLPCLIFVFMLRPVS